MVLRHRACSRLDGLRASGHAAAIMIVVGNIGIGTFIIRIIANGVGICTGLAVPT